MSAISGTGSEAGRHHFRRAVLTCAPLIALFIAALVAYLRLAGTSPIAWIDTVNDESEVQRCLRDDSCTKTGVSTSVPGQAHAVAWLEWRTLLASLGIGLDGTHIAIQVLNALAVVLVFHLATQLGGPLAGTVAVWIFMDHIQELLRVTALYNSSVLLFLGAVFVLACAAVVDRPGVLSVMLAALVGAVMANVHLACVLTGASVAWVALMAPRHRIPLAAFGVTLFVLATVALAPPTWQQNVINLIQQPAGHATHAVTVSGNATQRWAVLAIGAWAASFALRDPAWAPFRRRLGGAIAVLVPLFAAFVAGPRFGLHAEGKYLLHVKAACAIAAALPLAAVARALLAALSPRLVLRPSERVLPLALAGGIALAPGLVFGGGVAAAADERTPTMADLRTIVKILRDERHWDSAYLVQRLKTPYGAPVLAALRQLTSERVAAGVDRPDAHSGALVLVLETGDVPDPLPPGWTVVGGSSQASTVLISTRSRVNWSEFVVCVQPADGSERRCEQSEWRFDEVSGLFVPSMPPAAHDWRGTVELQLTFQPDANGYSEEIFMPRGRFVCGGRVVAISGGAARVDANRRRATVSVHESGAAQPPTITLAWNIGAPECDVMAYDGQPPFLVMGDSASVPAVETILQRRESW